TRVALRVNSKIDSRTILDASGAEDLLGHGDMLFLGPGKIEPERVHGAFISDDEVNNICDAWRERAAPNYVDEILTPYDEEPTSRGFEDGDGASDRDALYDQCVSFVLETRKASTSSLQRKLDRKSTRLNSSHVKSSYAVFCLKKEKEEYESNGYARSNV